MRLSLDGGSLGNDPGPSNLPEMRQTNHGSLTTRPEFARPQVYYGEGPFDPPSSEDEDDLVMRRASEEDNDPESASLLHQNLPSSPGRAERGDTSPRRIADSEKVSLYWNMCVFQTKQSSGYNLEACLCPRFGSLIDCFNICGCSHRRVCRLCVLWNIVSY